MPAILPCIYISNASYPSHSYATYPRLNLCCLLNQHWLPFPMPKLPLTNSSLNPSRCIYQWYLCWISSLSLLKGIGQILTPYRYTKIPHAISVAKKRTCTCCACNGALTQVCQLLTCVVARHIEFVRLGPSLPPLPFFFFLFYPTNISIWPMFRGS